VCCGCISQFLHWFQYPEWSWSATVNMYTI
jgi:hypothetical protein